MMGCTHPTQAASIRRGLANDVAQILLVRQDASGASTGYFIYLIRGQDGIWHIDGM
jgi:hypothetical protein